MTRLIVVLTLSCLSTLEAGFFAVYVSYQFLLMEANWTQGYTLWAILSTLQFLTIHTIAAIVFVKFIKRKNAEAKIQNEEFLARQKRQEEQKNLP